ncbi:MAG: fucose isomerase [Phycisphaerales bacterium]
MAKYSLPEVDKVKPVAKRTAVLVASGDLRESANVACWPAQQELEAATGAAFRDLGWRLVRADTCRPGAAHGFIASQAQGRDVFAGVHPDAPLVVAEAVWQYSHHVLHGLERHRGPILILANWSGQWPGLVGALNLRGSLTKAGVEYSLLWGEDFAAKPFRKKLRRWLESGRIKHDTSQVQRLDPRDLPKKERKLGEALAAELARRPAILGVFDEGCMGMFNAIIPDHLLHACGAYKERLSQSALYYAMSRVSDAEADEARRWLDSKGMKFQTGRDEATELTDAQIRRQLKMYVAAARLAEEFGCDAIGIQYQQGLKDLCPASDLAEGLLNCSDRPPVAASPGGAPIRPGRPITHFNEVDECAGLDGLITERVWRAMGLEGDNTLHDLRWGDWWEGELAKEGAKPQKGKGPEVHAAGRQYVWVFEISGAVPPSHFEGSYAGATSERQPAMYFRLGGGTIKGVSKPGEVVWSRVFVDGSKGRGGGGALCMDIGRCRAISLPREETERRWRSTTSQWPIMHAVLYGIDRDQMMARHQANHIQVVYAPDAETADRALAAKAAMAAAMGMRVHLCGESADRRALGERLRKL